MLPPSVNIVLSVRLGTLQVSFNNNNTQDSGSQMSQISGPLFTEDKLSTSSGSDWEICDKELTHLQKHLHL